MGIKLLRIAGIDVHVNRLAALLLAGVLPTAASAADILSARYDPIADELVVGIAYRGTHQNHEFVLTWDACRPAEGERPQRVAARIVDRQGYDEARTDYRVHERFSLENLPCRPALVTLRLGRVAHATVLVPDEEQASAGR